MVRTINKVVPSTSTTEAVLSPGLICTAAVAMVAAHVETTGGGDEDGMGGGNGGSSLVSIITSTVFRLRRSSVGTPPCTRVSVIITADVDVEVEEAET